MNNIIKKLKDRNITSQIRYYGINDMATSFEIRNIVENYELYNELIELIKPTICSIDEYIDYLYIKCLKNYKEVLPYVRSDLKEKMQIFFSKIDKKYDEYKKEDLAKFVSKNYKKILLNDFDELYIKHDVIDFTIEYICMFCSKDKMAIEFIIKNFSFKIYNHFDKFVKIFDESNDLYYYDLLLDKKLLSKDLNFRLEKIEIVLQHLKEKNEHLYNKKINILIDILKKETFNASIDDVMNKYFLLRDSIEVLKKLKHPKCYEFEKELNNQENIKDEYVQKNGVMHTFEINVNPIIEILKKEDLDWFIKSLAITHLKKGGKIVSVFENVMENASKKGLLDDAKTNIKTDDTFTYSTINSLSIVLMHGKQILNYMINDNSKLNELMSYIILGIESYFKEDSLYYNKENLELDIDMVCDAINELSEAYESKNEIRVMRIIYGLELQLCGIIEKILRIINCDINKEQTYVSFDSVSLNSLLKSDNIQKEIGNGNCQCIQYLLSKRNGNIGKNIRNNFSHYNDEVYEKLELDTILETLYILLVISNTLYLKK